MQQMQQIIKSHLGYLNRYFIVRKMKRTHYESRGKNRPENFVLQIGTSRYSQLYSHYLKTEFYTVQQLIKSLVKKPFCRDYYLKYPLEGLLRGVCKKLMINVYEFILYGYFLSQVEWRLDHYIYNSLAEVFPNIIHVNQPTDVITLKHLSMFLYFSSYSVKEFLNEDMQIIKEQMLKLFPEFQHLQSHWTSNQQTVGQVLNPKVLNTFYKETYRSDTMLDFNTCVDKILQVSPCYDIASKNDKPKELPSFGFMGNGGQTYALDLQGQVGLNIKIEDNIEDYQFDGDI